MSIVLLRSTFRDRLVLKPLVKGKRTFADSFMAIVEVTSHIYKQTPDDKQANIMSYHFISSNHMDIVASMLIPTTLHLHGGE